MKKMSYLILILLVGCSSSPSPYQETHAMMQENQRRLQAEYDLISQDSNNLQTIKNDLATEQVNFIETLNDEQLVLYEDYVSATKFEQMAIKDKRLMRVLSEEQKKAHLDIMQRQIDIVDQTRDIDNRYQYLLQKDQQNKQFIQAVYNSFLNEQQRQRQAWQNYQQQQMHNAQYNYYMRAEINP